MSSDAILVHHPDSSQDSVGTWTIIFKSVAVGVCFAFPGADKCVRPKRVNISMSQFSQHHEMQSPVPVEVGLWHPFSLHRVEEHFDGWKPEEIFGISLK